MKKTNNNSPKGRNNDKNPPLEGSDTPKNFGSRRIIEKVQDSKKADTKKTSRKVEPTTDTDRDKRSPTSGQKANATPSRKKHTESPRKGSTQSTEVGYKSRSEGAGSSQKSGSASKTRKPSWKQLDKEEAASIEKAPPQQKMPLNKYLAHSGLCSRREAADVVRLGNVKVNDQTVTDPGHKVEPGDVVTVNDKKMALQKGLVYILLNKPKDYITTTDDPKDRKKVMDLVTGTEADRLFPVGRLDRKTTGLLLITNDGELTQRLSHPSFKIKKVYQVTLNKPLTKADFEKIVNGITLDDGLITVDAIAYLDKKTEIGLEIHSGRNRIVRRIFEHLGYEVDKLDRVMYAGLTKKNLPRGKWRYLSDREIVLLKHFKS